MSVRILVTPEELEGIASKFNTGAHDSRSQTQQLEQALRSLEGKWDGATKKRFFDQFEQSKRHMEAYVQLLENIDKELRQIATRFRTVDAQ
ncbi:MULTISPECIES: WXG100 family type VII secretion target [Fictibacillus]|uniref:ESAT-6-like protein n=1 Tax=Fictibacillus terranigra TaxID=3058424 RepID=A0ABT8ED84_9BACL|nr:WXG100 family type VII secretion target [Fictibacillus sp. CENA-BCM004]MDN4075886.1 WXG100 family type VII secretion target [Fictibacillus sp. CENA-BCM004]